VNEPGDRGARRSGNRTRWRGAFLGLALAVGLLLARRAEASVELDEDFPTPPALAPVVRFWVDVFTRYSNEDVIVHDRLDPSLIHCVVPAREPDALERTLRSVEERFVLATWARHPANVLLGQEPEALPRVRTQRGLREAFAQALVSQRLYRPVVEAALRSEGLPAALAALPLVESSYHPWATSPAGAVGLWQMTEGTASQYLRISDRADERRDPKRASAAAARHLRLLRSRLPTWPLALTAYNNGLRGTQNARAAVGSDDLADLVARYRGRGFGFASRNYYARFLAALQVSGEVERHFPELAPRRMVEYRVKRGDTLYGVARRHGVSPISLQVTNGLRSAALQPGQRILIRL
jgi:membrane-bound lytic murein transglycosylase D